MRYFAVWLKYMENIAIFSRFKAFKYFQMKKTLDIEGVFRYKICLCGE
jgi:hypothetical protein